MSYAPLTAVQRQLVTDHIGLARYLARRAQCGLLDLDEARSTAHLALVNAASGYDPARGPFPAYARAVIRGSLLHAIRSARRRAMEPLDGTEAGVEFDRVADADLKARIDRAVQSLPERLQTACRLRWWHGAGLSEIGAELGVCRSRVGQLLDEAVRLLSAELASLA